MKVLSWGKVRGAPDFLEGDQLRHTVVRLMGRLANAKQIMEFHQSAHHLEFSCRRARGDIWLLVYKLFSM